MDEQELKITEEDVSSMFSDDTETEQLEQNNTQNNKKPKKKPNKAVIIISSVVGVLCVAGLSVLGYITYQKNSEIYQQASSLMDNYEYEQAMELYSQIKKFKDSNDKYNTCRYEILSAKYEEALALKDIGEYAQASDAFAELGSFEDSASKVKECDDTERRLYVEHLGTEVYKINKYKELAMSTVEIIIQDWSIANAQGLDATTTLKKTYDNWSDTLKKLKIGYDGLREQVNDIVELDSASEAYDKFIEIYNTYLEIHECAVSPSGELNSYIKNVKEYSKTFDSLIEEIYVIEPEIKQQVQKEVSDAAEKEKIEAEKLITN